jgi:hypothetical protein
MRKRHSGLPAMLVDMSSALTGFAIHPRLPERKPAIAGAINLACGCLESLRRRRRFDDR